MRLSPLSLHLLSLLLALHSLPALSAPSMFEELEQDIDHKSPRQKREAPAPLNAAAVTANFLPYPGSALPVPAPIAVPVPAKEAAYKAPAQERQAPAPPGNQAAAAAAAAAPPAPDPAAAPPNPAPPPLQNPPSIASISNNRAAILASKFGPASTGTAAPPTATACPGIGAHNPDMPDQPLTGYKPPADTNPVPGAWTVACGTLTDKWTMSDTFYLSGPPVQLSWVLDSALGVVGNQSEDPLVMVPVVPFVAVTAGRKQLDSFVPRAGVAYSVQLEGTPAQVGVSWWMNLV
ncbi:hypothetical protein MMC27_003582 [Xylographa pallens]|nr:hypothetical protein [Xylographa pallens]